MSLLPSLWTIERASGVNDEHYDDRRCIMLCVSLFVYVVAPATPIGELACGGRWNGIVIADRVVLALRLQYPDLNLQGQLPCLPCAELCLHGTSICFCVFLFCLDSCWHSPKVHRLIEAGGSVRNEAAEEGACNCYGRCVLSFILSWFS